MIKRIHHILAVLVLALLLLGSRGSALASALDSFNLPQSAHACCQPKAKHRQAIVATVHAPSCDCRLSRTTPSALISGSSSTLHSVFTEPARDSNPVQVVQTASTQARIWLRKLYYPDKSRLFLRKQSLLL